MCLQKSESQLQGSVLFMMISLSCHSKSSVHWQEMHVGWRESCGRTDLCSEGCCGVCEGKVRSRTSYRVGAAGKTEMSSPSEPLSTGLWGSHRPGTGSWPRHRKLAQVLEVGPGQGTLALSSLFFFFISLFWCSSLGLFASRVCDSFVIV